jgi:aminopeptidase N
LKKQPLFLLLVSILFLAACKVRPVSEQAQSRPAPEVLGVSPTNLSQPRSFPYRPSQTKVFDLIHTSLKVSFDWEKERMEGEAVLTLRPWFDPAQTLVLDAKGFILHQVAIETPSGRKKLKYQYDNEKLSIDLEKAYLRSDTLKIFIAYTARPSELQGLVSEEAADDQGLYFINPRGDIAGKPRQIWTQGESHGSPAWFPTFDTPNQRCTEDIYITVADSFKTLSNGVLEDVKQNGNGTRTDHWRMDLPHSPYLFMMAIGNYAVVKDSWRGKEVSYYVEPAYAQYARLVFGHTPEMMEFFSQRLGVDFPWPKYAQVVVRDFVSGAMENTSATTHYGRLQHDAREHLDATEEDIISHELFHQWFGDLVTCESWSNLSLNEGFATYGEYLWIEHKYGKEEATRHLLNDRGAYLRQASRQAYPIIRYHHQNADAMFDAHTYQKGGQVLHMLRHLVGDDAFFEALKRYLNNNAFDDVEIHKLRLAFEEVTGQDLNWFFDQWFLQPGHPELEMRHKYANGI